MSVGVSEFQLIQIYRKIERAKDLLGDIKDEGEVTDILGGVLAELNGVLRG